MLASNDWNVVCEHEHTLLYPSIFFRIFESPFWIGIRLGIINQSLIVELYAAVYKLNINIDRSILSISHYLSLLSLLNFRYFMLQ